VKNNPQFEPPVREHPHPLGLPRSRLHRLAHVVGLVAASILMFVLGGVLSSTGIVRKCIGIVAPALQGLEKRVDEGVDAPRLSRARDWVGRQKLEGNRPSPAFLDVGTTKEEVLRIQGEPDRVSEEVWYYGASTIRFRDGRVTGWSSDTSRPIKVRSGQP